MTARPDTVARGRVGVGTQLRSRADRTHDQVVEIQRSRMVNAAIDIVREEGYARMTVANVIGRARVSRKTFYDIFEDREVCLQAAFDHVVARTRALAQDACADARGWQDALRAALARLLLLIDEEPGFARLILVESLRAGELLRDRRAELLAELARLIDTGRLHPKARLDPPQITAEGIVGALTSILYARVIADDGGPATELLGPLMSIVVLPYRGPAAARRELARPNPQITRQPSSVSPVATIDPLAGLNMRVTYRTMSVLSVIANRAGASNREVGRLSGIVDQGQISKLLHRLLKLDLLENRGEGQKSGAANAWHLTPRGAQVERVTRLR